MITIKTKEEIEVMAKGGKILKSIVDELGNHVAVGVSGLELEKMAESRIKDNGGGFSFKGQDGFPSCLCFSVNEEIVHGVPDKRVLKNGDIVTLDLGIYFPLSKFVSEIDEKKYPNLKKGFHTDMARTYLVGEVDSEIKRLVKATKKALKRGISAIKPGITFGELGHEIQKFSEAQGFSVVRNLCGHGIGADLHEEPDVLNYGKKWEGEVMEEGMVFCIEPMLSTGSYKIKKRGMAYITEDNSLTAHFEDMVVVTACGGKILTE